MTGTSIESRPKAPIVVLYEANREARIRQVSRGHFVVTTDIIQLVNLGHEGLKICRGDQIYRGRILYILPTEYIDKHARHQLIIIAALAYEELKESNTDQTDKFGIRPRVYNHDHAIIVYVEFGDEPGSPDFSVPAFNDVTTLENQTWKIRVVSAEKHVWPRDPSMNATTVSDGIRTAAQRNGLHQQDCGSSRAYYRQ